jgi:hypothetical protein
MDWPFCSRNTTLQENTQFCCVLSHAISLLISTRWNTHGSIFQYPSRNNITELVSVSTSSLNATQILQTLTSKILLAYISAYVERIYLKLKASIQRTCITNDVSLGAIGH